MPSEDASEKDMPFGGFLILNIRAIFGIIELE